MKITALGSTLLTLSINELSPDEVSAVVTGGAANMLAAHKLVQEEFPKVHGIRCGSHTLNLLAADIEKLVSLTEHINRCKDIIKLLQVLH